MIIELDNQNFSDLIMNGLVLVDFYASWCGPCKMMYPIIEAISKEYQDLKIIKVDVDKNEDIAREYSIMSIPTLILFKDSNIIQKNIGFIPKEQLEIWIKNN